MNCYERSRTNYFPVKDEKAFFAACDDVHGMEVVKADDEIALLFEDGVPCTMGENDNIDFDLIEFLKPHLPDDHVVILTGVAYEGMRFTVGFAVAFNNTGKQVHITTEDIYEKAAAAIPEGVISRAED